MEQSCPHCHKRIPTDAACCPYCEAELEETAQADPVCPSCKKPLKPGWKRCPYCKQEVGPVFDNTRGVFNNAGGKFTGRDHIEQHFHGGLPQGSPAYEYEVVVVGILKAGGSLERARRDLDTRREQLRLSLKDAREIERLCREQFTDEDVAEPPLAPPVWAPPPEPESSLPEGLVGIKAERCELLQEQERCAQELGWAVAVRDRFGQEFVLIPPGEFTYGGYFGHDVQQRVIEQAFYMGKYPVTRAQWERFVREEGYDWDENLEQSPKPNCPVTEVSWDDAQAYSRWLSRESGLEYRLPTEEEWEKAARGTDGRKYPWGNVEPSPRYAHYGQDGGYGTTLPVGSLPAGRSPYGCQDMAGNVWEWCEDWYDSRQESRVLRGGCYLSNPPMLLASYRHIYHPDFRRDRGGFRVLLVG